MEDMSKGKDINKALQGKTTPNKMRASRIRAMIVSKRSKR